MTDHPTNRVLGPNVAGGWYPTEAPALEQLVDGLLAPPGDAIELEGPAAGGRVRAVFAPHAGLRYSGAVAGSAFRSLRRQRFDRVLLMGPSHYAAFEGGCLPESSAYRTPLGRVPIDPSAISSLANQPGLRRDDGPFLREHCLEAEIPFLQRCLLPGWRLIPLLIGASGGAEDARRVAAALHPLFDENTLLVVSTDFTHYGRRFGYVPFEDERPRRIHELDHGAVERILAGDPDGLREYVARTGATICGREAIDVALRILPSNFEAGLAAYDTSGNITGDWEHSVSYASLVFREPVAAPTAAS